MANLILYIPTLFTCLGTWTSAKRRNGETPMALSAGGTQSRIRGAGIGVEGRKLL